MEILSYRQKLIKLAESSKHSWRVVQEFEAHPLAEASDDGKKIYRAKVKTDRKVKQERRNWVMRYRPYSTPMGYDTSPPTTTTTQQQGRYQGNKKPGNCFLFFFVVPRGTCVRSTKLIDQIIMSR